MHACVGHPKSRATDDHERVTEDLSRRLGENLKDDERVIQNHPVFAAPPSRITLLYDAHVAQVIKHPSPSSDSSHLPAQPQTMWNVLRSFGTKNGVSRACEGKTNQSFADTNSIFALRKSQGQLARRNTFLPLTCIAVFSGLVTNSRSPDGSTDHTITTFTYFQACILRIGLLQAQVPHEDVG